MQEILAVLNEYTGKYKNELSITEEISTEINNNVFIQIIFKHKIKKYSEILWCDYLLAEKDEEKMRRHIIDFIKSFFINAFYNISICAYSNVLEEFKVNDTKRCSNCKRADKGQNVNGFICGLSFTKVSAYNVCPEWKEKNE